MFAYVKKQNGSKVKFEGKKIAKEISRAAKIAGWEENTKIDFLTEQVIQRLEKEFKGEVLEGRDIQNTIKTVLREEGEHDIADSYERTLANENKLKEINVSILKSLEEVTFEASRESDLKRENANVNADTPMGIMLKYGTETAKKFNHLYFIDPDISKAHLNGDIHIHDLDFYTLTTTCCQIDLEKLFQDGFNTGHGFIREPNSIASYSALACIALQSNQNDQHGGQSIPMLDFYLAKGVAKTFIKSVVDILDIKYNLKDGEEIYSKLKEYLKENKLILNEKGKQYLKGLINKYLKLTDEEFGQVYEKAILYTERATYQAMESLIHNLNTMHSRAGAQVPFSSVNYGTDITEEGRTVIRNLLLATESGLGNGETPIFPIQIFKIKEGVNLNPGEPNYDLFKLACRVSAKRLYPNFSFLDAPFNFKYYKPGKPETEVAYMGCRTRVLGNVYDPSREIVTGRGNLSFTSINLPRLALIAGKGNLNAFYQLLKEKMDLVLKQLNVRFKIQASKKVRNFPFLMGQGVWIDSEKLNTDDKLGDILKHGTLSVGFIGLAETLTVLTGFHHGECDKAQEIGLKIVKTMREYLDKESKKHKLNYSLLATPAEGLAGRFVKLDKKRFGVIPGVTDKDYYTNSFHIPVNYEISLFIKLEKEAPYHALTNAGHISYIELNGDPTKNLKAFEKIIKFMKEVGIGYGAVNHPVDRDPECGYVGIIDDICPGCKRKADDKIERIRRITGYLVGTLERFNNAKLSELKDRVKHG